LCIGSQQHERRIANAHPGAKECRSRTVSKESSFSKSSLDEAGAILTEKGTSFYPIQELDDFAIDLLISLPKVGGLFLDSISRLSV